jgi:hypothetical protein
MPSTFAYDDRLARTINCHMPMVFMAFKRRSIQQLAYSMAMLEPQESAESKYLGHRMLLEL